MGQMTQWREVCRFSALHFELWDFDGVQDRAEDAFGVDGLVPGAAIFPLDSQSFGLFPTV